MDIDNQSTKGNELLDLFEGVDESPELIKPITEGLGFKDRVSEGVYTDEVEQEFSVSSDCGTLDIGRVGESDSGTLDVSANGGVSVSSSLGAQPILFHSGHDGLIKKTAKKSGESVFGAFIDVLMVFSTSILVTAFIAEFTAYNFNPEKIMALNKIELGKLFVVFAAFYLVYKIAARVFYGRTLGEWSSRHQLGLLNQQHKFYYPIQVLVREIVSLGTGVFTLPLLSLLFRKDMGFYFSGLQTYIEQKK